MNQPQLNPRDGAHIPKREQLTPDQKKVMDEVERLTKDEAAAFAVLAQAQAATAEAAEDCADLLSDIKDLLVKALSHFSVPLPTAIAASMKAEVGSEAEYDPDALSIEDDKEDEDEAAE